MNTQVKIKCQISKIRAAIKNQRPEKFLTIEQSSKEVTLKIEKKEKSFSKLTNSIMVELQKETSILNIVKKLKTTRQNVDRVRKLVSNKT